MIKLSWQSTGGGVARLRDDVRVFDQRLRSLEQRVAAVEENLACLSKEYARLDLALSVSQSGPGARRRVG